MYKCLRRGTKIYKKMSCVRYIFSLVRVFFCICSCNGDLLIRANGNLDSNNFGKHILQLEETVTQLQSQLQAQEQKKAAVLSSLLSKLTSTTNELTNVKSDLESQHNSSLEESAAVKTQLEANAKEISNLQSALTTLQSDYKSQTSELEKTKEDLKSTTEDLTRVKMEIISLKDTCNDTLLKMTPIKEELHSTGDELKNKTNSLQCKVTQLEAALQSTQKNVSGIRTVTDGNSVSLQRLSANMSASIVSSDNIVAFSSGLEVMANLSNQTVVYSRVFTNVGSSYDSNTGVFTCPRSGVYTFMINGVTQPNGRMSLVLVHNQQSLASVYADPSSRMVGVSNSAVLTLKTGNQVKVVSVDNSALQGNAYYM